MKYVVIFTVTNLLFSLTGPFTKAQEVPDHEPFDELVREVVVDSLVDYEKLLERRALLDEYLASLSRTDPEALARASDDDQLAFWINAYNACMLLRAGDNYPIESGGVGFFGSLRNRVAGRPANSVWQIGDVFSGDFCEVAGEERSLDEIEHDIIRPVHQEPRIHFAVNCAAYSCPRLADEAYVGAKLDEQLDRQVNDFIDDARHFRLEQEDGRAVLWLNEVLDWYSEDFGGEAGLAEFFAPYLSPEEQKLILDPDLQIRFFDYDWTLNDIHAKREP